MAEVFVETARLVLRGEAPGDRETWLRSINTPEVMAFLGGPKSPEKVAENFARMAEPSQFPWLLMALKAEGTLIGKCGLGRIESAAASVGLRGQVEVGWTVRADYWRCGYGREAAEAMLGLAFGRYALETVIAQTSDSNVPSWRLMERLRMHRRAEFDYHDPEYPPADNPTIIYSLDRAEWSG
jgi:RimJ/RimL family protein N-acetyltransferase